MIRLLTLLFISSSSIFAEWNPLSLTRGAQWQINKTTSYDPSYVALDYPNGDIPIETGVCTDVIIRAFRKASQIDLQKLVHLDMKSHFQKYPTIWGLTRPDRNIDHRRVPNLQTYFKRKGYNIKIGKSPSDFQAGDIVTCIVPPNLPHIMIISDQKNSSGTPLVIHNIGSGTIEEDCLFNFQLTGHYRISTP